MCGKATHTLMYQTNHLRRRFFFLPGIFERIVVILYVSLGSM